MGREIKQEKGNSERKTHTHTQVRTRTHTHTWCLFQYCVSRISVCESVVTDYPWEVISILFISVPEEIKMQEGILLIRALTQIHSVNPLLESQKNFTENSSSGQEHLVFLNIMNEWSREDLNFLKDLLSIHGQEPGYDVQTGGEWRLDW